MDPFGPDEGVAPPIRPQVPKPAAQSKARVGRKYPMIPVSSLRDWKPNKDDVDAILATPKGALEVKL